MCIELHNIMYIVNVYDCMCASGFLSPNVASTVQTAAPLPCTGASENQNKILKQSKNYIHANS